MDGDGDGTAACDIGAFEFFPLVNDFVTLDPALETAFDPMPVLEGQRAPSPSRRRSPTRATRRCTSPSLLVTELSGDNLLLNAEEGAQGVGATVPLVVGARSWRPGRRWRSTLSLASRRRRRSGSLSICLRNRCPEGPVVAERAAHPMYRRKYRRQGIGAVVVRVVTDGCHREALGPVRVRESNQPARHSGKSLSSWTSSHALKGRGNIRDGQVAEWMDNTRAEAIEVFSALCRESGVL